MSRHKKPMPGRRVEAIVFEKLTDDFKRIDRFLFRLGCETVNEISMDENSGALEIPRHFGDLVQCDTFLNQLQKAGSRDFKSAGHGDAPGIGHGFSQTFVELLVEADVSPPADLQSTAQDFFRQTPLSQRRRRRLVDEVKSGAAGLGDDRFHLIGQY